MTQIQSVGRFHCRACWEKTIHLVVEGHEQEVDAPIECEMCGNVIDRINTLEYDKNGKPFYRKIHPITVEMRRRAIARFRDEVKSRMLSLPIDSVENKWV